MLASGQHALDGGERILSGRGDVRVDQAGIADGEMSNLSAVFDSEGTSSFPSSVATLRVV